MVQNLWMSLANNAAILLALFIIYELSYLFSSEKKLLKQIINGFIAAGICIIIMSIPFSIYPGILFDTRAISISVTAFVFGVIPASITVIAAIIFRIIIGGIGLVPGIIIILTSALIGLAWRKWFYPKQSKKRWLNLYLMSIIVHTFVLLNALLLPYPQNIDIIKQIFLPVLFLYPLTSVLLSELLLHQKERIFFQEKLVQSEQTYRNIAENMTDVVWITDLNLKTNYISPSAQKLFGESPEEYMQKSLEEKLTPGSLKLVKLFLAHELEKEKKHVRDEDRTYELEAEHYKADGTVICLGMSMKFIRNEKGKAIGIQGVSRDITQKKKAEFALKQERDKAQMYLEVAHVIFVAFDKQMNVTLINREGCRLLGLSKKDILGKNWIDNFVPERYKPQLRQRLQKILKENADIFTKNENPIVDNHGNEIIISWRNTALKDDSGKTSGILSSGIDITEKEKTMAALKESERSKSVFISHIPGIAYRCAFDKSWTMEFISDGCYALTGYKPEDIINNNKLAFNDLICDKYRQEVWDEWAKVIAPRATFAMEYEIKTASGETKWVFETGQAIYNDKGDVEALEGVIIDINKSKKQFLKIQYMDNHDQLTGLYNRKYFEEKKKLFDKKENLPISIIIADINGLRLINDAFGHLVGDELIKCTGDIIKESCPENAIPARTGGDEFSIITVNTNPEEARKTLDLIVQKCEEYNFKLPKDSGMLNVSLGYALKGKEEKKLEEVKKEAEDNMYKHKLLDRESHHNAIIKSVMATMYARSQETEEHAERIAKLSVLIGEKLNLPQKNLDDLQLLAMLHDIGKIGIDDSILNKKGALTDEEWVEMKKHPEIGYRITMSSSELESVALYILHHHERWDGNGYPSGLSGKEIPLLSRILAVVDAFDAMTQDRVYRKGISVPDAIKEIKKYSGTQFDPEIVELFINLIKEKTNLS